jgi:tetratricopeptide (TPR) repeat protein
MYGDTLVLACAEEDWDYANDLAEDLSQTGMNIARVEYGLSALKGQRLFQFLDAVADREISHEILLLLSHHYVTNQANSTSPSNERYVFHVYLDDIDTSVSPPWILCIKKPVIIKPKPDSVRASSKPQTDSPDSFDKPNRSVGIPRRPPVKKDKPTDKPNRQNRTRRFATVLRGLEEAIQFDDANPAAYSGLGNVFWCLERYEEACQAYLKAIQYDPGNASSYDGLGSTLWCLERYDNALQCYEEATRLS